MTDKGIDNLKFGIIEQAAIDYVDLLAGFKSPTTDCNVDEDGSGCTEQCKTGLP